MKRITAELDDVWASHALRAVLMILSLNLISCADDKKTVPASTHTFDLNVSLTGLGQVTSNPAGIDCGSDCTETLAAESSITLNAIPNSGFTFTGWSSDCSGSTTSCDLTMNQNRAATATFTATTGATGYIIYYGTSNTSLTSTIMVTGGSTTEYQVTGLPTGISYYFQISAVDLDGIEGIKSAMISVPL